MLEGPKSSCYPDEPITIKVENAYLEQVHQFKYLGPQIMLEQKLNSNAYIAKKAKNNFEEQVIHVKTTELEIESMHTPAMSVETSVICDVYLYIWL